MAHLSLNLERASTPDAVFKMTSTSWRMSNENILWLKVTFLASDTNIANYLKYLVVLYDASLVLRCFLY